MKWCITEGLQTDLNSPALRANMVQYRDSQGDGLFSAPVESGLGGQLEVARVPIARWGGNKSGRGDKERIVFFLVDDGVGMPQFVMCPGQ